MDQIFILLTVFLAAFFIYSLELGSCSLDLILKLILQLLFC